jgi:hypothetical protein
MEYNTMDYTELFFRWNFLGLVHLDIFIENLDGAQLTQSLLDKETTKSVNWKSIVSSFIRMGIR